MKVIADIQVRMGSQRLPGKAFTKISGKSAIEWIGERLKACKELDGRVLVTSDQAKDDPLEKLARKMKIPCFRGSETDLVQRHLGSARLFKADAVLRVTGDCPLVDPGLVDRMISTFRVQSKRYDFFCNYFPPSYPDGLDLDLLPTKTLARMDREITTPLHREWLTTYILERPQNFRILNLPNVEDLSFLRWTLDYAEDLALMRAVFRNLLPKKPRFGMQDVLNLMKNRPDLQNINENRVDKTVLQGYRSHAYHELVKKEAAAAGRK